MNQTWILHRIDCVYFIFPWHPSMIILLNLIDLYAVHYQKYTEMQSYNSWETHPPSLHTHTTHTSVDIVEKTYVLIKQCDN